MKNAFGAGDFSIVLFSIVLLCYLFNRSFPHKHTEKENRIKVITKYMVPFLPQCPPSCCSRQQCIITKRHLKDVGLIKYNP